MIVRGLWDQSLLYESVQMKFVSSMHDFPTEACASAHDGEPGCKVPCRTHDVYSIPTASTRLPFPSWGATGTAQQVLPQLKALEKASSSGEGERDATPPDQLLRTDGYGQALGSWELARVAGGVRLSVALYTTAVFRHPLRTSMTIVLTADNSTEPVLGSKAPSTGDAVCISRSLRPVRHLPLPEPCFIEVQPVAVGQRASSTGAINSRSARMGCGSLACRYVVHDPPRSGVRGPTAAAEKGPVSRSAGCRRVIIVCRLRVNLRRKVCRVGGGLSS